MDKRRIIESIVTVVACSLFAAGYCFLSGLVVLLLGDIGIMVAVVLGMVYMFFGYELLFPLINLVVDYLCDRYTHV